MSSPKRAGCWRGGVRTSAEPEWQWLASAFAFLPQFLLGLTNIDPPAVQSFHGDEKALPLASNPVGHRDSTVFKDHCAGWLGVPPHLAKIRVWVAAQGFPFPVDRSL